MTIGFSIVGIYAAHLVSSDYAAQFKYDNYPIWVLWPNALLDYARGLGFGPAVVAVGITVLHLIIYSVSSLVLVYGIRTLFYRYRHREAKRAADVMPEVSRHPVPEDALLPPDVPAEPVILAGEKTYRDLSPRYVLRLRRIALQTTRKVSGPIEQLHLELREVLKAHADWSVDPSGHHADVGLEQHSREVAARLIELEPNDPLAVVIGLAHDIGKLLAYKPRKLPSGASYWERRSVNHDVLGGLIVRNLPAFKQLNENDAATLNLVVTFAHRPDAIPPRVNTTRVQHLLNCLRRADGLSTAQDKRRPEQLMDNPAIMDDVLECLPRAIESLNINGAINSNAEVQGWMLLVSDIVVIREDQLRAALRGLVSPNTLMMLALEANQDPGRPHPSAAAICKALERLGLVLHGYNQCVSKNGLHTIKAGKNRYPNVWVLHKDEVKELIGSAVFSTWGNSPYRLTIRDY